MKKIVFVLTLFCVCCTAVWGVGAEKETVTSPDRRIVIGASVGTSLEWELSRNGEVLLLPSRLGLRFKGKKPFGEMTILRKTRNKVDATWKNRLFKKALIRDEANELILNLQEKAAPHRKLDLIFRAYNTGIAFRYGIPAQPGFETFELTADDTTYWFPRNEIGWFTTYGGYKTSQEEPFWKQTIRSIFSSSLIGCPMVIRTGKSFAAFTEADLTDWAGMFFSVGNPHDQPPVGAKIVTRLSPRLDGHGLVVSAAPRLSPWRVVILGDRPVDLIANNDLILNLNPPPAGGDAAFDWVKPGATAWDWWGDGNRELSTEKIKEKILFAAEMGWPFITIDAPWYGRPVVGKGTSMIVPRSDLDFPACFALAKEKGIGIYLWGYWSTLEANGVDTVFDVFEKWGVKGVKIDFMDRQDQEMVNWYEKVVSSAARHKIMVNFHGAFKPTGMNRTWPNQITREGIQGNEFNKFFNSQTPYHTATLPFTRYLLGPGDYTPGSFRNVHSEQFVCQTKRYASAPEGTVLCAEEMGTRAHALALCVAYDSPLMTLCDWPENYRGQAGLDALRRLPTVWDETLPLEGEIGEYYTVVRKSADGSWYLASLTVAPRTLVCPLSFLGKGTYTATIYVDAPESDKDACVLAPVREKSVSAKDTLSLNLVREGGAVVILRPAGR